MICNIHVNEKLSTEQFLAIVQVSGQELERYPDDYQYEYLRGHLKGGFKADPSELLKTAALKGLNMTIEVGAVPIREVDQVIIALKEINQRLSRIEVKVFEDGSVSSQQINNRVDVHVPNLGLLRVDEVEMLENGCTYDLQKKLDEGWRILALCPQPDQRRPDYVLGRTQAE